jgi:3-methyladenine DNA glycosylase AlkD
MLKSLLSSSQKEKIKKLIREEKFESVIDILDSLKTEHAQTARMLDKRFTIAEIVKYIIDTNKDKSDKHREKIFYTLGRKICMLKSDNAKEVGIHIIWRAYNYNRKEVEAMLMKISDDPNWEVREYAAGAVAATVANFSIFYKTLELWRKHRSENVRRVVVMSVSGLKNKKDSTCTKKTFALIEPLLYDSSVYVKKNLGPFAIGSWYGYSFPKETFQALDNWIKIKDEHVRWNIAMTFNNSFGNHYPQKALKYLRVLSKDKNKVVQRAVRSTLRSLNKRHPALISKFCTENAIFI